MYIYNVTVAIDSSIHNDWLKWMKEVHIPDVMNTGFFTENRICKVVTDETDITYAIQYLFHKMDDLTAYQKSMHPDYKENIQKNLKINLQPLEPSLK